MFSPETSEIAKPSELLTSVRAYMNVLQSVENYIHVDMTRIFNNVLLQQTQQTDSNGEPTIGKDTTGHTAPRGDKSKNQCLQILIEYTFPCSK